MTDESSGNADATATAAANAGSDNSAALRGDASHRFREARAYILDMDGVLYRGRTVLPGVADLLNALDLRGLPYMLATNNSSATASEYVEKLAGMGIAVDESSILTSGMATLDYLVETYPAGSGIYVVGSPALREALFADSPFHAVQYREEIPAVVVVGLDTSFTYEKLASATAAIRAGAHFVATNADLTLPTEQGLVPGCGSIVAAIAAASGQPPIVIGKPEPLILQQALDRMGVSAGQAVMIGDRLDTDIIAGDRAGLLTIMVLTGVSTREEIPSAPVAPDLVFNDLPALLDALTSGGD